MHVLFLPSFYPDPEKPVLGSFFRDQAQALAKAGVQVRVAYCEPRRLRAFSTKTFRENHFQITDALEEGLPTTRLHGWNPLRQFFPGGLLWSLATAYLAGRCIRDHGRPDLIHAHNAHWAGFAAFLISRRHRVPYVVTEHSGGYLTGEINATLRRFARTAYMSASRVIAVSSALRRSLATFLLDKPIQVIPNCIDVDFFTPHPVDGTRPYYVFLALAHLSENKGFDILLRAFALAFVGDPSTKLLIGGDGPIRGSLHALCEHLGIKDKVVFLGSLSRDQVRGAMWNANALVVPSFHETFGVVLIEALATGLPVVATRSGGPEDIVTDEVGILVPTGNVCELARAMMRLRSATAFSKESLRRYAVTRFSQESVAGALCEVYGDVCRTRS